MLRTVLKSKIQEAHVSSTELFYEGSLAIDQDLLDAADIIFGEQIHVLNVTTGNRVITYAIPGKRGSGTISVKGAAARLFEEGDTVIVLSFAQLDDTELDAYSHRVLYVDDNNRLLRVEDRSQEDYRQKRH